MDIEKEIISMNKSIGNIEGSIQGMKDTLEQYIVGHEKSCDIQTREHILLRNKVDKMAIKNEKTKGQLKSEMKGISDAIEGHVNNEKEHYKDPELDGKWGWAKRHPYLFTFITISTASGAGTIGYVIVTEVIPRIFGG